MKAIILAAGASNRLRPLTDTLPKCLLQIGGKTLLERTIDTLLSLGIEEIGIVIGYRREMIRTFVKEHYPFHRIHFIVNPHYESTNNAYSLLLAREYSLKGFRESGAAIPLLLLDSDILFSGELLHRFLREGAATSLAVRVAGEHDEEEVRVTLKPDGTIASIGKEIPLAQSYGESIGIEQFLPNDARTLFAVLEERVRSGVGRTEFYEASFQVLIDSGHPIQAVDVSALPIVEIDTPEDYEAAKLLFDRTTFSTS